MPALWARDCFFDDNGNEYCSQDGSGWNSWGRWVALSVLLSFIGLFIILAWMTARRRRRQGLAPYWGTRWAGGRGRYANSAAPGTHMYAHTAPAPHGYYGNQPAPPYAPAAPHDPYAAPPYGPQSGVELHNMPPMYNKEGGHHAAAATNNSGYAPPPGPPPAH